MFMLLWLGYKVYGCHEATLEICVYIWNSWSLLKLMINVETHDHCWNSWLLFELMITVETHAHSSNFCFWILHYFFHIIVCKHIDVTKIVWISQTITHLTDNTPHSLSLSLLSSFLYTFRHLTISLRFFETLCHTDSVLRFSLVYLHHENETAGSLSPRWTCTQQFPCK